MQLRGRAAMGYAFDRRYGSEHSSDSIYNDCVANLVEHLFKVSMMDQHHCSCSSCFSVSTDSTMFSILTAVPQRYIHLTDCQEAQRLL